MTDRQLVEAQFWVSLVALIVNTAGFVAIVVYVVKTWHIATATERAAAATTMSTQATERSAETSQAVLEEMRVTREVEAAPYVVAYFDAAPSSPLVSVVVSNLGKLPAKDVRIAFDPPLVGRFSANDQPVTLPNFLKEPIPFLPPQVVLKSLMWSAVALAGSADVPRAYTASVSFEDAQTGRRHAHSYVLDLDSFMGKMYTTERTLTDIYNLLERLTKRLERPE